MKKYLLSLGALCFISFTPGHSQNNIDFAYVRGDSFLVPVAGYHSGEWINYGYYGTRKKHNLKDSTWHFRNLAGTDSEIKINGDYQEKRDYYYQIRRGYPVAYTQYGDGSYSYKIGLAVTVKLPVALFQTYDFRYDSISSIDQEVISFLQVQTSDEYKNFYQAFQDSNIITDFTDISLPQPEDLDTFHISYLGKSKKSLGNNIFYFFDIAEPIDNNGLCFLNEAWIIKGNDNSLRYLNQTYDLQFCYERKGYEGFDPYSVFILNSKTYILGNITQWEGYNVTLLQLSDHEEFIFRRPNEYPSPE